VQELAQDEVERAVVRGRLHEVVHAEPAQPLAQRVEVLGVDADPGRRAARLVDRERGQLERPAAAGHEQLAGHRQPVLDLVPAPVQGLEAEAAQRVRDAVELALVVEQQCARAGHAALFGEPGG